MVFPAAFEAMSEGQSGEAAAKSKKEAVSTSGKEELYATLRAMQIRIGELDGLVAALQVRIDGL